ncbi:MAG: hypothetical protein LBG43_03405 [Treponema sp.]|jgi:hypothetical protein|nr:hypothetical protein [Treponema sp.]
MEAMAAGALRDCVAKKQLKIIQMFPRGKDLAHESYEKALDNSCDELSDKYVYRFALCMERIRNPNGRTLERCHWEKRGKP